MAKGWGDGIGIEVLTTKPGHLSSLPGTYMVGENQLLTSTCAVWNVHTPPQETQIYLNIVDKMCFISSTYFVIGSVSCG